MVDRWLQHALPGDSLLVQAARVFGSIGVALVVLAAMAALLKVRELDEARAFAIGRLRRLTR
jgi:hypothetical protein